MAAIVAPILELELPLEINALDDQEKKRQRGGRV